MPAHYGPDLAHIQATVYSGFARTAAPGLLKILRDAGLRRGACVVDLGCGDGSWLKALTDAGFAAVGMDASPALVEIARRSAPQAEIFRSTLAGFAIPPCDAITAIGEVLAYASPAGQLPNLEKFIRRAARALRPGGVLVFDVILDGKPMGQRNWREGEGWAIMVDVAEDRRGRTLTRNITTFRRTGRAWKRRDERHVQKVFSRAEVLGALRRAGLTVKTLTAYGKQPMLPGRLGFVARKAL